jgi:hypothetical protein
VATGVAQVGQPELSNELPPEDDPEWPPDEPLCEGEDLLDGAGAERVGAGSGAGAGWDSTAGALSLGSRPEALVLETGGAARCLAACSGLGGAGSSKLSRGAVVRRTGIAALTGAASSRADASAAEVLPALVTRPIAKQVANTAPIIARKIRVGVSIRGHSRPVRLQRRSARKVLMRMDRGSV